MRKILVSILLAVGIMVPAQVTEASYSYTIPNYSTCVDPALQALGDRVCLDLSTPYGPRAWTYDTATHYVSYVNITSEAVPSCFQPILQSFITPGGQTSVSWGYPASIGTNTTVTTLEPGCQQPPVSYPYWFTLWSNSTNCDPNDSWVASFYYCSSSSWTYWQNMANALLNPSVEFIVLT